MIRVMTDEELQQAIQDVNEALNSLAGPNQFEGPFPQCEITRREIILLRQVTVYKILEAREKREKHLELFNTDIYNAMTSLLQSYKYNEDES